MDERVWFVSIDASPSEVKDKLVSVINGVARRRE